MPPNARSDRYEPLPGVTEIPGFLYRKLGRAAAGRAQLVAAVLVVALAAGIVFGLPAITDSKEERGAAEQRRGAKRRAERQARCRPRCGCCRAAARPRAGSRAAALTARRALAWTTSPPRFRQDAVARVQAGEFAQSVRRASSASGSRAPWTARTRPKTSVAGPGATPAWRSPPTRRRSRATSPAASATRTARWSTSPVGRFAYCKVSGRPGEGSRRSSVPSARAEACGGDRLQHTRGPGHMFAVQMPHEPARRPPATSATGSPAPPRGPRPPRAAPRCAAAARDRRAAARWRSPR